MPRSSVPPVAAALLALVLVTGCTARPPIDDASARGTPAQETSPAGLTTTPATEGAGTTTEAAGTTTRSPATETSGAGGTRTRVVEPAVSVPKLPIGGSGQGSEHEQCVSVNFRGEQPLPSGVRITVTGVSLTPPLLAVGGSACAPEEIPCLGSGFAFTAGAGTCFVPVRGTGPRVDPEDEDVVDERVRLSVAAVVRCPVGEQQTCDEIAAGLADDQTIELDIRVPASSAEPTGGSTEEGGATTGEGGSTEGGGGTTGEGGTTEGGGGTTGEGGSTEGGGGTTGEGGATGETTGESATDGGADPPTG